MLIKFPIMEKVILKLFAILKEEQTGKIVPFLIGFSIALLIVIYMFIKPFK